LRHEESEWETKMSEGLNRVTVIGNVGKDPELRFTQGNQGVLSFSVAANESWFDATSKERKERTEWVNVVVWGKRGEGLNKVLAKGSRIYVEGRLQTRSWDDKTGAKRYTTEVVATNVLLLGGKGERAGNGSTDRDESPKPPSGYGDTQQGFDASDDIPF
jgi:single-strand DNA-binding protein